MRIAAAIALLMVLAAPAAAQRHRDELAPFVRASQIVREGGVEAVAEFIVRDDLPLMRYRQAGGRELAIVPVRDPQMMLAYLADMRLSGLWPAMLEWAGPELAHAAEAGLKRNHDAFTTGWSRAPNNSAESTSRPGVRALLQYADMLRKTGYRREAAALLQAERAAMPRRDEWQRVEWTMVTLRLGTILSSIGERNAAIDLFAAAEAELGASDYAPNFSINRAAFLAEAGRYAEALAAIDAARAAFDTVQDADPHVEGNAKVAGSDRQFDWVRACALKGLGREKESAVLMAKVRAAPEPRDEFFVTSPNLELLLRADLCLRDRESLVGDLVQGARLGIPSVIAGSWLQRDTVMFDPVAGALLSDAQRDPRVVAATRGRVRQLPAKLVPALNAWKGLAPPAALPDTPAK